MLGARSLFLVNPLLGAAAVGGVLLLSDPQSRHVLSGGINALVAGLGNVFAKEAESLDASKEEGSGRTADEIIASEKKGSIRREFPGEMLGKTRAEIDALAQSGDRTARTARKLLNDLRFNKRN